MGQYYKLLAVGLKEYIYPPKLAGIKMWEILNNSGSAVDALGILLSHTEGPARPADLVIDGTTGRWAGQAPLYVGDYAEDGDVPGWRWSTPEGNAYHACEDQVDDDDNVITKSDWTELSSSVQNIMERTCGHVFVERDSRRPVRVPVKRAADGGWDVDTSGEMSAYYREEIEKARDEVRARTDLDFLDHDAYGDGQSRLIVNLDKLEYIDPAQFGETPTLAGMLKACEGDWSSLKALSGMLFHHESRGGGDCEGPTVGRWRGDRLVVLGDAPTAAYPSHDEVRQTYRDVSAVAAANPLN